MHFVVLQPAFSFLFFLLLLLLLLLLLFCFHAGHREHGGSRRTMHATSGSVETNQGVRHICWCHHACTDLKQTHIRVRRAVMQQSSPCPARSFIRPLPPDDVLSFFLFLSFDEGKGLGVSGLTNVGEDEIDERAVGVVETWQAVTNRQVLVLNKRRVQKLGRRALCKPLTHVLLCQWILAQELE